MTDGDGTKLTRISLIIPCFNEEANVNPFYERTKAVFNTVLSSFEPELIFVDDFSTDGTIAAIEAIMELDPRVKLVRNARNYGVYRSSFNALKHATGDAVLPMIPVDMQDPPEEIPKLVQFWEQGYEVVSGTRYERDENALLRGVRHLYYRLVTRMASFDLPKYAGEFQILDAKVVKAVLDYDDYYPYTRALIARVSGNRKLVPYRWEKRQFGRSKHGFLKLYDQAVNGIISTSTVPLRVMTFVGALLAMGCFAFVILQIVVYLAFSHALTPPGVSTLIVAVFFCFGMMFIFLGVLGEYIGAVHSQVRRGPLVRETDE